jgi:hypothetical protein
VISCASCGGGGRPPTKFSKVPFFREQSALFFREKYRSDCIENLNLCYVRNIFSISGKNIIYAEKILVCRENFFEMNFPPVANITGKKFLDALFIRKVPLKACPPPQLLVDASYAPVYENIRLFVYNRMKNLMRSIKTFKFKNTTDLLI